MINETKTRHIDLTVPTGWNQCTTAQLEQIAQILLRRMAMQDRYHPYDPLQMKTEAFFALAGLGVVEAEGDDTFLVRQRRAHHRWGQSPFQRLRHHTGDSPHSDTPFPIAVWQVHSFVNQHLGWLDDFTGLWIFPYERFGRDYGRWHFEWWRPRWLRLPVPYPVPRELHGPAPLFDGLSWQQYRQANEWLDSYTMLNNQLAQQRSMVNGQWSMVNGQLQNAREQFLKALFGVSHLSYTPTRLRQMRADQFQLVLIWWQSMMKVMMEKYKRCFKKGKNGQSSMANGQLRLPIDIYTRSTATLQDKYHLTEEQINETPCRVILQHLEDMAQEAEELERIQRQSKSHR